jgi:hypothetical protein
MAPLPDLPRSPSASRRWLIRLALAATAGGLVVGNALALGHATRLRAEWPPEVDTFHLPPAGTLRVASLGHRELAADLLHGKANVYFGTKVTTKTPAKWLARYINAAIDLDPHFHRLYLSGATMVVYTGQPITPEVLLTANAILERGRKIYPLDWEIPFQLGFNYLYELPTAAPEGDPRVPGWRQKGLEYLQFASQFDEVPYYLPALVARLLTKQGSSELAIEQLQRAYAATSSEEARESIRRKLISLRGRAAGSRLEAQRRDFLQRIAATYPFLPEALALLVGPHLTAPGILAPPESSQVQP